MGDFLDDTKFSLREICALQTILRSWGDKAASVGQDAATNGDSEGAAFHLGRQAAFLSAYNLLRECGRDKSREV